MLIKVNTLLNIPQTRHQKPFGHPQRLDNTASTMRKRTVGYENYIR